MEAGRGGSARLGGTIVLLLLCASGLLLLSACSRTSEKEPVGSIETSGTPSAAPKDLGTAEVRDYKGEPLDSVEGFRRAQIGETPKVDRASYRLRIDGRVGIPASYSYQHIVSVEASHTKVLRISCIEGWSVKILWEGVLLSDLIDRARPATDAVTVIFHAADGYTTSLPLEYVRSRQILLAYRQNGLEIPPERGFPFQVVAEDRYGYKWCKWVTRIELSPNADYRGYWESRGFNNDATVRGP